MAEPKIIQLVDEYLKRLSKDKRGPAVATLVDYLRKTYWFETMRPEARDYLTPKPLPEGCVKCPVKECDGTGQFEQDEGFWVLVQCSVCEGRGHVKKEVADAYWQKHPYLKDNA